jgi:hypothetical protein
MNGPKQTADNLGTLTDAWTRLAPNDQFAGLTIAQFKTAIQPALTARDQLAQIELDYNHQLTTRMTADDAANTVYKRVVYGIRSHPSYGDNSGLIRALGYITDMERASGLTRSAASTTTGTATPAAPAANTTQTGSTAPASTAVTGTVAK